MKVSELKGDDLDYWTARADGFDEDLIIRPLRADGSKRTTVCMDDGSWQSHCYTNDWRLTGPLIEKFNLDLFNGQDKPTDQMWHANDGAEVYAQGDTPNEALCRAAVQSVFGYEVDQ